MLRRPPAGEPRRREVGASPEEVHRARLADEASTERVHHPMRLHEREPEPPRGIRVVRPMHVVVVERNRVGNLRRARVDLHRDTDVFERGHRRSIEARHRPRLERHLTPRTVGGSHVEHVIDEVELDLQAAPTHVHERRRQTARGNVERHLPPLVDHRAERQPNLPDDLRPEMQRVPGVFPLGQRELRPRAVLTGETLHAISRPSGPGIRPSTIRRRGSLPAW